MRNLLVLEFNEANRPKHVTQYVELVDCLIDTPEDVALLQKSHVIERHSMMITDEYVAKIEFLWDCTVLTGRERTSPEAVAGIKAEFPTVA
ncbi:hypothetical protein SUGI_0370680 [Cryptomeria japonica]|nr:hypothetical protein SUGI_0370680 [Cryptomeria japonica]